MPSSKAKGKARARETDPLLGESSILVPEPPRESTLWGWISITLIVLSSIVLAAGLFLALLAWSFKPSEKELASIHKSFKYASPESIQVLNVTDEGVLVNVTIPCGIETNRAFGLNREKGAEWWESIRKWAAKTAVETYPVVQVDLPRPVVVYDGSKPLLQLNITSTMLVPLITGSLQPMWMTVMARPIASTGDIWEFVRRGWGEGSVKVIVEVEKALAGVPGWNYQLEKSISLKLDVPIPRLPGLPAPGHELNLSSIVELEKYKLDEDLGLWAIGSLPNFWPFNATLDYGLPFAIFTEGEEMARVVTEPIKIQGGRIKIELKGKVTHLGDNLSAFLQRFLHGEDNPIMVYGLSESPQPASAPPQWLLSTLPTLNLSLSFPGPRPPPKILHSVTIEHMRISESGGKITASGLVIADVRLPEELARVRVNVGAVDPDILVYDGEVTEEKLFGHIHPGWVASTTEITEDGMIVRAPIVDAPLDVLPGRDGIFRGFVSKVVFKGGAEAGIGGNASVRANLMEQSLSLEGLPVTGSCWIGRR